MRQRIAAFGMAVVLAAGVPLAQSSKPAGGVALADLSWIDAEPVLTPSSVVVIPLGAGVLEQGLHLKLNNDERLARYLGARVQAAAPVVMAPPLTYHFYPAFLEYPGSASLTQATARAMTVEIVRSFARYGPRRFYVLNTEPDAMTALSEAAKTLADGGILLGYTDPRFRLQRPSVQLRQSPILVAHADEVATSIMLFVDP
jgi:creatinine amidohydrolase